MRIPRRAAIGALAFPALAGCTGGFSAATIPVTLATAQQEAAAILTALQSIAAGIVPTLPAGAQAAVGTALAAAQDAVGVLAAVPAGGSYAQAAQAVIARLTPLVGLIPLPAGTALAVTEGLTLVAALIKGLSAIPAPSSTVGGSIAVGVVPADVVPAPIPIPLA